MISAAASAPPPIPEAGLPTAALNHFHRSWLVGHTALQRQGAVGDRAEQMDLPRVVAALAKGLRLDGHVETVAFGELAVAQRRRHLQWVRVVERQRHLEVEAGERVGARVVGAIASSFGACNWPSPSRVSSTVRNSIGCDGATRICAIIWPWSASAGLLTLSSIVMR